MSTPFAIATEDIFADPNFRETATLGSSTITVIASSVTEDPTVTAFGIDGGVSFFLRVLASEAMPRKNDLITFRGVEYRAAACTLDAAGLVWRVDLASKTSR